MKKVIHTLNAAVVALTVTFVPPSSEARSSMERWFSDTDLDLIRSGDVKTTPFVANTSYAVCFTPGQDCEGLIVNDAYSSHVDQSVQQRNQQTQL